MTTGHRMKIRRQELRIPVDVVAKALDVSIATIYRYENGEIEKVPGSVLEPLAQILQTTPAYIMGWTNEPSTEIEDSNVASLPPPIVTEIKTLIHDQRKRLGYTLEALAKLVGVSKQTVQKWESGKIGDMKRSHIAALSTALNIPIEILVGIESNFEPYIPLTHHEGKVVIAYRNKPLVQPYVDKLLDVEPEEETTPPEGGANPVPLFPRSSSQVNHWDDNSLLSRKLADNPAPWDHQPSPDQENGNK